MCFFSLLGVTVEKDCKVVQMWCSDSGSSFCDWVELSYVSVGFSNRPHTYSFIHSSIHLFITSINYWLVHSAFINWFINLPIMILQRSDDAISVEVPVGPQYHGIAVTITTLLCTLIGTGWTLSQIIH